MRSSGIGAYLARNATSPGGWQAGSITDHTQMTLVAAEGILRSAVRSRDRGDTNARSVVHQAYRRWLYTQGERAERLEHEPELRAG